jgi:hypothetical protein
MIPLVASALSLFLVFDAVVSTAKMMLMAAASEPADIGSFIMNEASLETHIKDPPSIVSQSSSTDDSESTLDINVPTTDIVSIGSISRLDHLTAQIETWASHLSTRHFWGFSELNDFDPECASSTTPDKLENFNTCTDFFGALQRRDNDIGSFFSMYYGVTEGGRIRSNDSGWVCAQRRPGRAFGWLHSQYAGGATTIPDYLLLVDDDSYLDMVEVVRILEGMEKKREGEAFGVAGCVFEREKG